VEIALASSKQTANQMADCVETGRLGRSTHGLQILQLYESYAQANDLIASRTPNEKELVGTVPDEEGTCLGMVVACGMNSALAASRAHSSFLGQIPDTSSTR
jgi:hypothetical protein